MGHSALSITPDFRARTFKMRQWIIWIIKLIQHSALTLLLHFLRQVPSPFHTVALTDFDKFGTIGCHGPFALICGVVRHDQGHLIAFHGGDHCQGDSSIAAGGLDKTVAGLNVAPCLGFGDHA